MGGTFLPAVLWEPGVEGVSETVERFGALAVSDYYPERTLFSGSQHAKRAHF